MSEATIEQIEALFRRQVRMCIGIGVERMMAILLEAVDDPNTFLRADELTDDELIAAQQVEIVLNRKRIRELLKSLKLLLAWHDEVTKYTPVPSPLGIEEAHIALADSPSFPAPAEGDKT